jgi:hypothetical protein
MKSKEPLERSGGSFALGICVHTGSMIRLVLTVTGAILLSLTAGGGERSVRASRGYVSIAYFASATW